MCHFNNPINFQYFNIEPARSETFSFNDVIVSIIRANKRFLLYRKNSTIPIIVQQIERFILKKKNSILSEYFYSIPSRRVRKTEINQSGFIFTTVVPYSLNDFFTLLLSERSMNGSSSIAPLL